MWQRRTLQSHLGSADAVIQLSLPLLKRYLLLQPKNPAAEVTLIGTGQGGTGGQFKLPGGDWSYSYSTKTVSIASILLSSLGSTPTGEATAIWEITLKIATTLKTARGKFTTATIPEGSALAELVQTYEGIYGDSRLSGLIMRGDPIAVPTQTSQSTLNSSAMAELTTPLIVTSDPTNGIINIKPELSGASLNINPSTTTDDSSLEAGIAPHLSQLIMGQFPNICPPLSVVGQLNGESPVPEVTPIHCKLRTAGSGATSTLCAYVCTNSSFAAASPVVDLTMGADSAYLARESVLSRVLAFCIRTGLFPMHWRSEVTQEKINDGSQVNILVSFDFTSVSLAVVPYQASDTRQEDRINFVGTVSSKVLEVKMADGSPAPEDVRKQITANSTSVFTLPVFFSNVGTPAINPEPQLETWYQSLRLNVTKRFSVPLAASVIYSLVERSVNGNEKVMLTRFNLSI